MLYPQLVRLHQATKRGVQREQEKAPALSRKFALTAFAMPFQAQRDFLLITDMEE
jgi:hypothetical protein